MLIYFILCKENVVQEYGWFELLTQHIHNITKL